MVVPTWPDSDAPGHAENTSPVYLGVLANPSEAHVSLEQQTLKNLFRQLADALTHVCLFAINILAKTEKVVASHQPPITCVSVVP
jgi:hypothetical protein